ncbi:hypothetical protein KKA00_07720 [bacterium]|nr:hypothetical protein [bacterium]MBU1652094.1 hypothetical protein [bacterium]
MKVLRASVILVLAAALIFGCAERNDPAGPGSSGIRYISQMAAQGIANDIAVANGRVYIADEPYGISIYDVSSPLSPLLLQVIPLPGTNTKASKIAVDPTGRVACVETGSQGQLHFYDLNNGNYLNWRGSGGHEEIDLVYENSELHIYRCDQSETDGFNYEVFANIGTEDSLSFGSLGAPTFFSVYQEIYSLYGFARTDNDIAFISRDARGLAIVDFNVPNSATMIAEINPSGRVRDASLVGDVLCLAAGYDGLITLDVSDPSAPEIMGTLAIQNATDIKWVETSGSLAFLLDDFDGVFAVDLSNPNNPTLMGEVNLSDPSGICIDGDYIYISDRDMGLVVCKITG